MSDRRKTKRPGKDRRDGIDRRLLLRRDTNRAETPERRMAERRQS